MGSQFPRLSRVPSPETGPNRGSTSDSDGTSAPYSEAVGGLHRTRFQKNKHPKGFCFLFSFSISRLLETTKTLVYYLSAAINGEANVAIDPSFRGLLSRLDRPPGTQRLGTASSESRRPGLRQ